MNLLVLLLQIVHDYLKNASGIVIVADITRAINDKTAKTMLDESFRRQLYLDGHYGSIIFVATMTDNVVPCEARNTFGLDAKATKRECALTRSRHVKTSILKDFAAGLNDLQSNSNRPIEGEIQIGLEFELPVVCVSSMQYQLMKKLRELDGDAIVYENISETGIPELQKIILKKALNSRTEKYSGLFKIFQSIFDRVEAALKQEGYSQEHKDYIETLTLKVDNMFKQKIESISSNLTGKFDLVRNKIATGVEIAELQVEGKAEKWMATAHQTLKAAVVRDGVYRRVDINDSLGAPILGAIANIWNSEFNHRIPVEVQEILEQGVEEAVGDSSSNCDQFRSLLRQHILANLSQLSHTLKSTLVDASRELNRTIVPEVQT